MGRSKNHLKRKVRVWRTRYAAAEQAEQAALRRMHHAETQYNDMLRRVWAAYDEGTLTNKQTQAVLGITGFSWSFAREVHLARKDMAANLSQQVFG